MLQGPSDHTKRCLAVARAILCPVAVCGLASFAAAGYAAQPEDGTFRLLASTMADFTHVRLGNMTYTGGNLIGTTTVIESSGGPFAEGADFLTRCVVYSQSSGPDFSIEAPCVLTDSEGSEVNFFIIRESGNLVAGGDGRMEIQGGTGAYSGMTGECVYTAEYLPGQAFAVTDAACSWQQSSE